MADQPKKPRNVKDLKARLGRTISPSTKGGGQNPVPPPAGGGAGAPGGVTPPTGAAPGGSPFAAPAQPSSSPPAARDPFAAASQPPPAQQQEVKFVFDDKLVEDQEIGRGGGKGRAYLVGGLFIVLGLALGYGAGSIMKDRNIYNVAVRDGKDVFKAVRDASDVMNEAKKHVDAAVSAAKGGTGGKPSVDYEALEQLRSLENPFTANQFSRKNYNLFAAVTVDQLFDYYANVNELFEKFQRVANSALPENKREALDRAAEAAGNMATQQTGCVPDIVENRFMCGLVYVQFPDVAEGEQASAKVQVTTSPGAPNSYEKEIYVGQDLSSGDASDYVMLVNTQRSVGVLGQQASVFAEYNRKLIELSQLMARTVEIQGSLENELGKIASLTEVFAL